MFDPKKVVSVLLANGWQDIKEGSFRVDSRSGTTRAAVPPVRHEVLVTSDGVSFEDEAAWSEGEVFEVRCRADKIIAVKVR